MTSLPLRRRSRNGKIARLPEPIRERINVMLDDGVRYRDIIQTLEKPGSPPLPYPISAMNLSNWNKGGYQDWRRRQERLELNRRLPFPSSAQAASLPSIPNLLQMLRAQLGRADPPPQAQSQLDPAPRELPAPLKNCS